METPWYFLDGEQERGPMSIDNLLQHLAEKPYLYEVLVWRDGLSEWQPAGTVPELRKRLPPPPLTGLYGAKPVPFAKAEQIAKYFRRLVLLVGLRLLCNLVLVILLMMPTQSLLHALLLVAVGLGSLTLVVTIAITAYRLADPLEIGPPVLWAMFMLLPCFVLLGLLILSIQAQSWCKRYGIKVGFLGPTKKSIEEVRILTVPSMFD